MGDDESVGGESNGIALQSDRVDPAPGRSGNGLKIERRYTTAGVEPIDAVEYELRDSVIRDPDGTVVFEMRGVEVPKAWSQLATDIVASKYFRKNGVGGEGKGETSVRQVVRRIVDTIAVEGLRGGYFASPEDEGSFRDELAYMLLHQIGAFNSPVWFNLGLWHKYGIEGTGGNYAWDETLGKAAETTNAYERPQTSACFIAAVEDDLMSIFELVKQEARLFKHGSGTGSSFDKIRGKGEKLSGGGTSSGLMSWLKVLDAGAGSVKSGGGTRRAATMRTLSMDHPDIEAFIDWKKDEEKKAHALIAQGYPADFNGEAYQTVSGQNSNNSVRVTDEFMRAVVEDREWHTTYRTTGKVAKTYRARDLWRKIAEAAWACADPGVQYDTTMNEWHTCPESGKQRSTNPCCFQGNMSVDTNDGFYSFEELEAMSSCGDSLPFARANEVSTNRTVFRQITKAWVAGETTDLVSVHTKSSNTLRCTPEHKFLLGTGEYRAASDLRPGDFLRTSAGDGGRDEVLGVTSVCYAVPVKVYDIEVEGVHNFGVTCGASKATPVIVSNSEFSFVDDSSCNLASLNLTKFTNPISSDPLGFDVDAYRHAIRIFFLAQEILVDLASYPTAKIAENSHKLRPLGLGYANLGSLLMRSGIPYDSDEGRGVAGALTAILTGHAYRVSAQIASIKGSFGDFKKNREPMMRVMNKHRKAVYNIWSHHCPSGLLSAVVDDWNEAVRLGEIHGYRNAQATLLAPVGTIGLLMDCDTTGVEPDFALVKHKKLAGGGTLRIANASVGAALDRIGIRGVAKEDILEHVKNTGAMVGAPHLREDKLSIFDCASGVRAIRPMGHLEMMAAVQPFLSGSISKTVNISHTATVDDIADIYMQGWKLGLKSVALYRDGCKASQPLSTVPAKVEKSPISPPKELAPPSTTKPSRKRLPVRRKGFTQEAKVGGHKVFLRTGEYEDGQLGEIFIDMHKEGASFRSVMNCLAISVSMGLQYGVPLEAFVEQFTFTRFEPQGNVEGHENVKFATSIVDYVFRVLGVEYLRRYELAHVSPEVTHGETKASTVPMVEEDSKVVRVASGATNGSIGKLMGDAPMCDQCGHLTVRNGSCYRCWNCGASMGCS